MIKDVRNVFRVQSAMSCNRFLFWIKKLPLIRRLFPDRLYAASAAKQRLMAVVEVLKILSAFAGKFIYLFLCCLLPAMLLLKDAPQETLWLSFLTALFFFSFFGGAFLQSNILTASLVKYTCVRQMGMSARASLAATAGREHLQAFVTFTPALIVFAALFGPGWWAGLLLTVQLAAVRCIGELFHVWVWDRWEKQPGKSVWYIMAVTVLSLAGAYATLLLPAPLPMERFLFNPAVYIASVGCGAWAGIWLLRYPHYQALVWKTCRAENVSTAAAKQNAAQAAFRDVQMKDSDLAAEDAGGRIAAMKGYAYLNGLFFLRHRRLLNKPVKYALGIVAAAVLVGLGAVLFVPDTMAEMMAQFPVRFLPIFVFIMYLICNSLGQRICKAMFYNCDLSLLRYGWYRERKVLLRNFTIRLGEVAKRNLLVAAAICVGTAAVTLAAGAPLTGALVLFCLAVLSLAVFFSVHPLFLYYIFQPYTAQLAVKNPFFGILNWVVYFLCWMCLQIKQPTSVFTLLVVACTVAYSAVALAVVWNRAEKTFRIK